MRSLFFLSTAFVLIVAYTPARAQPTPLPPPTEIVVNLGDTVVVRLTYDGEVEWFGRSRPLLFEASTAPVPADSKSYDVTVKGVAVGTARLVAGLTNKTGAEVNVTVMGTPLPPPPGPTVVPPIGEPTITPTPAARPKISKPPAIPPAKVGLDLRYRLFGEPNYTTGAIYYTLPGTSADCPSGSG